jgi:hypothetical protein
MKRQKKFIIIKIMALKDESHASYTVNNLHLNNLAYHKLCIYSDTSLAKFILVDSLILYF